MDTDKMLYTQMLGHGSGRIWAIVENKGVGYTLEVTDVLGVLDPQPD
jgi:hypothetical protein